MPLTVTPTLTVGGTFSTGDYVGTSGTAMVFSGAAQGRAAAGGGGGGYIVSARVVDGTGAIGVNCELWLFDTPVTPPADNAAWSISDADAAHNVAIIPISTWYASALNTIGVGSPVAAARYDCAVGGDNLYGCLVTRGAPVYANGALTVRLTVIKD